MKKKLTLIPALAVAVMVMSTGNTQARHENDIVRQAHNIETIGRELKNEFQTHFSRSSAYRHLLSDVNLLLSKADHIDSLAHDPSTSYRHIKADLNELDNLAHHIHGLLDDIERGRYSGYVDGGLRHVHTKMASLNAAIHAMDRSLEAYNAPASSGCLFGASSSGNPWTRAMQPWISPFSNRAAVRNENSHGH